MPKFKVGDIVVATPDNKYGITNRIAIMRVKKTNRKNTIYDICVNIVGPKGYESDTDFYVESRFFRLKTPRKKITIVIGG